MYVCALVWLYFSVSVSVRLCAYVLYVCALECVSVCLRAIKCS